MNAATGSSDPSSLQTPMMKSLVMAQRKDREKTSPRRAAPGKGHAAFDVWLHRGLHQLFDEVAKEPVPDELLRLIEEDKKQH